VAFVTRRRVTDPKGWDCGPEPRTYLLRVDVSMRVELVADSFNVAGKRG